VTANPGLIEHDVSAIEICGCATGINMMYLLRCSEEETKMQDLLRAAAYALACLVMGIGVGNALAAEIAQPEGSSGVTACVQVFNQQIANNTPVLASDCSDRFGAYWHLNPTGVISGNGSSNFVSTCLSVKGNGRVVIFDCNPLFPGSGRQWEFRLGRLIVLNGPHASECLDSRGFYSLSAAAQLVVFPCTSSPTQDWTIK
jgi:hypothetical protein